MRLHWALAGEARKPPLVLLNSIGTDLHLWDGAMPHLMSHFHVLRIDTRGHGGSDAPDGDYSLAMLAEDVVAVMHAAGIRQATVAGVSLGGMIAMQLALDHPEQVTELVLICTSAAMDRQAWDVRISKVRREGTAAIAKMAVGRFLSADFRENHPAIVRTLENAIAAQPDAGYAGAAAAIRDMSLAERLSSINISTVVVTGKADISTPYAGHGDRLLATIPHSQHVALESAHLPPIEAPAALAALICRALPPVDVASRSG